MIEDDGGSREKKEGGEKKEEWSGRRKLKGEWNRAEAEGRREAGGGGRIERDESVWRREEGRGCGGSYG
jgi:hypothetical protein